MQHNRKHRTNARLIEVAGEWLPATEAARHLGLPASTLFSRLYRGWSDSLAVRASNEKSKPLRSTCRRYQQEIRA